MEIIKKIKKGVLIKAFNEALSHQAGQPESLLLKGWPGILTKEVTKCRDSC
jgi:hypothetical protein